MEIIVFLLSFAYAMFLANRTAVATEYLTLKLSAHDMSEKRTYLFGHLCGLFFGVYGFFIPAIYGGPYGFLWGIVVAAIAFPVFAFTILAFVRVSEAISDWRTGHCCS